jgi:Xaa-Pro dipeptidase
MQDTERIDRVREGLAEAGLDAVVAALPSDVLMLTGYWPVIGTSVAVVMRDGQSILIAPEDEADLARRGGQRETRLFRPGSLQSVAGIADTIRKPLEAALRSAGLTRGRIGLDAGPAHEPASYVGMFLYGTLLGELVAAGCPDAHVDAADEMLIRLRAVKTPAEVTRIRTACIIAGTAFTEGAGMLAPGMRETAAACAFAAPLSVEGVGRKGVERAGGYVSCMSGPNAARAWVAYARSGNRALENREFVLIHCNSYADGYWTDLTRTYCLGELDDRKRAMFGAVFAARKAALQALRPGVTGRAVDGAARSVLVERGFGPGFKHPTGHGVGFVAIDHDARPRLHPASDDILQTGMVFNVEPAIYTEGFGGLRHCDMAVVTETGAEFLTPFQGDLNALVLEGNRSWI